MNPKLETLRYNFLTKAIAKHGDRYSYDNMEYIDGTTETTITCTFHGDIQTSPRAHLSHAVGGCKECRAMIGNVSVATVNSVAKRLKHEQMMNMVEDVMSEDNRQGLGCEETPMPYDVYDAEPDDYQFHQYSRFDYHG